MARIVLRWIALPLSCLALAACAGDASTRDGGEDSSSSDAPRVVADQGAAPGPRSVEPDVGRVEPVGPPRTVLTELATLSGAPPQDWFLHWDAVAASPDGLKVAAAFKDEVTPASSRLGLWSTSDGGLIWMSSEAVWSEGCDFDPSGSRIGCAHQPRPDWGSTELLVFDAATGGILARRAAPALDATAQPEEFWGDSARFSPDGAWIAMTQAAAIFDQPLAQVLIFRVDATGLPSGQPHASFPFVTVDEVAFSADGAALYASDFLTSAVQRLRLVDGAWSVDGSRVLDADPPLHPAGTDIDGLGQVIVNGWGFEGAGTVLIVSESSEWSSAEVATVAVTGTSYELCADSRPGAHTAWAVSQDGAAQAIDTAAGVLLSEGVVAPVYPDGIAMDCANATGQPFLVSEGRLWTWTH